MLKMLSGMNVEVKSHMSSIDDKVIEEISRKFDEEKKTVQKEEDRKRELQSARTREAKKPDPPKKPQKKKRTRETGKGRHRHVVDEKAVRASVKKTLADLEIGKKRRRRRKSQDEDAGVDENDTRIRLSEFATVGEIAAALDVSPSDVIKKCMDLGLMVTINRRLDKDTIEMVADEFEHEVELVSEYGTESETGEASEEQLVTRHPVVTIMGHVDHGKTSLLDYIRKANVIAGETGGITQHVGAYEVETPGGRITFLDTPGHEAFSAMRARGAQVTDMVVLVVAAEEQIMPQTVEAIDHARAAGVPILIAINKIDLPAADPMRIKQQLAERGLQAEEWGGDTVAVEVSAKTGEGIDKLLEMLLLMAEMMELKGDPKRRMRGVVVEARLEPGRGVVITVLVQAGTLRVGDPFVAGVFGGKVRALFDERGKRKKEAGLSSPVEILGCSGVPQAGDSFGVFSNDREVREISTKRKQQMKDQTLSSRRHMTLEDMYSMIQAGETPKLHLVIKGDVDGSVEALTDSLQKLSCEKVTVEVIHRNVGNISESDVLLAAASNALIIGFHTKADTKAAILAKEEGVNIRFYQIIYEAVSDVEKAMEGLLEPELRQKITGEVEVREIFKVGRVGVIAGSYVRSGTVSRTSKVRIHREDHVIYEGRIASLKRFKDDVKEVQSGYECGIILEDFNDIEKGDILEIFLIEEIARSL